MDVILTHEQADFDALAAQLGAYLMNEQAFAVLPRRMNRNVRAFLNLYGADLPYMEPRDLPGENIQIITLVDTQSLVTLKGMTANTTVQVVDHHTLRADLPENWSVTIDPVGACTTLFVEGLREHNGDLNPILATLLLLGIYEDTGSLTYTSTTPRDIRAAAFLLEQGASLQILSRYLNPPLSDDQRQLYDQLLAAADRRTIHGQSILVARASAEDLNDEISTIAHKLRDLIDPDALFLLVRTSEGIRLVARSVSDHVDVSRVADHFGGGGHGRAAAALIRLTEKINQSGQAVKSPTLEEVYAELLRILPDTVQPSLTVRQIMSPRPIVLTLGTLAERAAQLMQRYGYEGYPVVEDGKVRGLLTRRAVDRSLGHKLNLTASSLMDSGDYSVHPGDSIEHLRRVMADSGWGQIPVVDPEDGAVIGIVTRTDLLKIMGDTAPSLGHINLGDKLEAALPAARLALLKEIAAKAHDQHMAVYVVGGFVRDLLMNRPSPDFDVVVEGDAIALAGALAECHGGKLLSHGRFGTAKWTIADVRTALAKSLSQDGLDPADLPESLDLISARTEFYDYPTALPTVERSSIKLDLHRRDFTINTMALRLDGRHYGELYDYWGGLRDLRRELVRVLHSLSFVDDPTRMMRAVRFEQRFGFQIEKRTLQLIDEARPLVRQVSGDRLRHEFMLIFSEERALEMLARLQELHLPSAIHPALNWQPGYAKVFSQALNGTVDPIWKLPEKIGSLPLRQALAFITWLAHFSREEAEAIAQRLRLPHEIRAGIDGVIRLREELPTLLDALPSVITTRLDQASPTTLFVLDLFESPGALREVIYNYLEIWRNTWPATNGDTLRQMGVPQGPRYRLILSRLRNAWLDGEITTVNEENHLLQELLQNLPENG